MKPERIQNTLKKFPKAKVQETQQQLTVTLPDHATALEFLEEVAAVLDVSVQNLLIRLQRNVVTLGFGDLPTIP